MKKDIESQFKYTGSRISLSESEKNFHREKILDFMEHHQEKSGAPVKSPFFNWSHFLQRHYVLAAFVLLILAGTGVGATANSAKPGDSLFGLKVNVLERAQMVLSFDQASKTALEIKFVDERLKEFAEWSTSEDASPEEIAVLTDSLTTQIKNVHTDIAALREDEDLDGALSSAADLQSTLAAHAEVLGQIDSNSASSEVLDSVSNTVDENLSLTEGIVHEVTEEMASSTDATVLPEAVTTQQQEITETIEDINQDVETDSTNLDTEDKKAIQESITTINSLLSEAKIKNDQGSSTEAFLISTQANQEANKLRITIDAEQELGVDSVDSTDEANSQE